MNDSSGPAPSEFIYVICQNGAEAAARLEMLTHHPNLRLAFSRPGFITFKVDPETLPLKFVLKSTLARAYGWSLGKATSDDALALVDRAVQASRELPIDRVHVIQRDPYLPGRNGFEPGVSALAADIATQMEQRFASDPENAKDNTNEVLFNRIAKPGQLVFDVVMVEPNEWWYGFRYAETVAGRWIGGTPQLDTGKEVFSRAYFKLREALLWTGLNIQPGECCAEIGSAPGGACQRLLEQEAVVLGIDPAEMEAELLENDQFTHIRRRVNEVRHRDFQPVKWLMVDLNLDPQYTLDMVSQINQYDQVNIKGMILTLKLADWNLVKSIPAMIEQVKGMGFPIVKTRQLAFNRQEFCLAAFRNKFVLRSGKRGKR